jgi:diguanylate cyclase (GGDEF)-like protein
MGYPFTDPLGATAVDDGGRPARRQLRRANRGLAVMGSVTLILTLLAPDSDTSDHRGLAVCALLLAVMAFAMQVWRDPPDWVLLAFTPIGSTIVTALVAVAKPIALIPLFYIWPLITSAYFLQRREVVLNYLVVIVGFGVALAGWVRPDARLIQWISIVVIGAVLTGLLVALKERMLLVVHRLQVLATRDPLTGALNRRAFSDHLDAEVARAGRAGGACAVAVLDVDHFKTINDRFGHAAGDRALERMADLIASRVRRGDAFGRLGGEEFAVLLAGSDAGGAAHFAEDLRAAVEADTDGDGRRLTISVGVAALDDGGGSADGMLLVADRALYAAKEAGRNRVMRGAPDSRQAAA